MNTKGLDGVGYNRPTAHLFGLTPTNYILLMMLAAK